MYIDPTSPAIKPLVIANPSEREQAYMFFAQRNATRVVWEQMQ